MIDPVTLNLRAQRWAPFIYQVNWEGEDLAGSTITMQARLYRDAPGDPILSLVNAEPVAQGLSVSVAALDLDPMSTVQIRINETTLEVLP
jgi:hypothetical protein